MKKHNEGYALVLVLVVMAVLTIVVTSVLSLSLRNLQAQQKSIQKMQDKYAAQGAIEIVVAQFNQGFELEVTGSDVNTALASKIENICNSVYGAAASTSEETTESGDETEKTTSELKQTLEISSQFDSVKVNCELDVVWEISTKAVTGLTTTYTAKASKITYKTYDITKNESGDSGISATEPTGGTT